MSSKTNFQEFQFPECSENRKKVDFHLTENVNSGHMERDSSLQLESEFDLRKSLAWDSAFFTSPGVLDPEELFETLNFQVVDNRVDIAGEKETMSLSSSQSIEPERMAGSGEPSMRKSLAWDSAFFTSAGVLDAEELSIVNKGFTKSETHPLPGIGEEIWRSAESNSTMFSDGCSLASLEIDLFDDIRASMYKSHDASSKRASSTCKLKRDKGMQNGYTSKTSDDASSRVRAASIRESKLSLKPPKVSSGSSGCANPLPTAPNKRASLGANHVKMENKGAKAESGRERTMSKKTCLRDLNGSISNTTTSVKSPSSVLSAAANEFAGFGYASSYVPGKSPPNPLRRTIDCQLAAAVSTSRTPLKYPAGDKSQSVKSSDSTCLLSTPKSSSCTSPGSSIDGWSLGSSAASLNQRPNNSAANHVTTACRGIFFDNDASEASECQSHHYDQPCWGCESQETRFKNPQINKITVGTGPVPASVSRKFKPSGLRMPSPKIGFFDAENSTGLAQNGDLNFKHTSSKIASGTSNVNGAANRSRFGKQRLAGALMGTVNKTGTKDKGQFCLRDKKQTLKEHGDVRVNDPENNLQRLGEDNKENIVSLENQVGDLIRHMEAIDFSRDLLTEFKVNKGPCLQLST